MTSTLSKSKHLNPEAPQVSLLIILNCLALTKKLVDKTRKEWEETLRKKREEY